MDHCDWCSLSEEDKRFQVYESKSWSVFLSDEQDYIGRCILVLKRHCNSLPELTADEYEYVLTTAEMGFYRKVQSDVNRIVGYSTDAMTITNADKPYANLSQTLAELANRQRILYYKMVRYTLL